MADKWINIGEEDEMKPYIEPPKDCLDNGRIGEYHSCSMFWAKYKRLRLVFNMFTCRG